MQKNILKVGIMSLLFTTSIFAGANAGVDQVVTSGELVQLQGSKSTLEKGGELFKFVWKQTAGSQMVELSNSRLTSPRFIAPSVQETTVLTFRLVTKERFKCRKRKCRKYKSKDFVNVTIKPKDDGSVIDPDSDFIVHKGFKYLSVTSPATGRVWLDRNLGADEACDRPRNKSCFGDLYQWGRDADGHQVRTSPTTIKLSTELNVGNNSFIRPYEDGDYTYSNDWLIGDSSGSIRSENWSKIDGTSVCPIGYRVPTFLELSDELSGDHYDFLNLANAGYREPFSGYTRRGKFHIWTSTPSGDGRARYIYHGTKFTSDEPFVATNKDTFVGLSIRCIQD